MIIMFGKQVNVLDLISELDRQYFYCVIWLLGFDRLVRHILIVMILIALSDQHVCLGSR